LVYLYKSNLGGPGADPEYKGGLKGTQSEVRAALQRVRQTLQEKVTAFARFEIPFFIVIFDVETILLILLMEI
jgi:hypothetical protein